MSGSNQVGVGVGSKCATGCSVSTRMAHPQGSNGLLQATKVEATRTFVAQAHNSCCLQPIISTTFCVSKESHKASSRFKGWGTRLQLLVIVTATYCSHFALYNTRHTRMNDHSAFTETRKTKENTASFQVPQSKGYVTALWLHTRALEFLKHLL